MHNGGLCCRLVSVRPSVTLVFSIRTAEDIVKCLSPPGSPITVVFWSRRRYPIASETASVGRKIHVGWKNVRISYWTAVEVGNGTR